LTHGVAHLLVGDLAPGQPVATHAPERAAALRAALFGARLFFKIDYYHPDHDTLAPVPGNIELCRRVLTVMLAEEY
jgi:hypothetical protein